MTNGIKTADKLSAMHHYVPQSYLRKFSDDLNKINENIQNTGVRADNWPETTEQAFNFITRARELFKNGDSITRRKAFIALGQNFTLKDQKLYIEQSDWLVPISKKLSTFTIRIS
jgi:hypothetical protein